MINFSINYPYNFEVVNSSSYDSGELSTVFKSGSYIFNVVVKRYGSSLNSKDDTVSFICRSGTTVAGRLNVLRTPDQYGLMPREFFRPFEYVYTFSGFIPSNGNTTELEVIGRSEKDVRDYQPIVMGANHTVPMRARLHAWRGKLFMVGERDIESDQTSQNRRVVAVYRFLEGYSGGDPNSNFFPVASFEDFAVSRSYSDGYQSYIGSPVFFEHDSSLFLAYCYFSDGAYYARMMRADSDSGTSWKETGRFYLGLKSDVGPFEALRLRVASDNTVILMTVMYRWVNSIGASPVEEDIREGDIKVYASYNSGKSFESEGEKLTGLSDVGNVFPGIYEQNRLMLGLFYTGIDSDSYQDINSFNINFDLYFDRNIGSFVILKAGDGDLKTFPSSYDLRNNCHLVGIRNANGSYFLWETILRIPLDYNISIPGQGETGNLFTSPLYEDRIENKSRFYSSVPDTDPLFSYGDRVEPHARSLELLDVCVVPNTGVNDLILCVRNCRIFRGGVDFEGNSISERGAAAIVTEFSFLPDDVIRPGDYKNQIYSYGGKFHKEICFFSGPMSIETSSIAPTGFRTFQAGTSSFNSLDWSDPTGCRWNDSLVVSSRRGGVLRFLAFLGSVSNLGERYGYESQWNPFVAPSLYGWISTGNITTQLNNTASSGVTVTSTSAPAQSGVSFLSMADTVLPDDQISSQSLSLGNFSRFKTVVGNISKYFKFKMKFSLDISFEPSDEIIRSVLIYNFIDTGGDHHSLFIMKDPSGNVRLFKRTVSAGQVFVVSSVVPDLLSSSGPRKKEIEVMLGTGVDANGADSFFAWFRLSSSLHPDYNKWTRLSSSTPFDPGVSHSVLQALLDTGKMYVGIIYKSGVLSGTSPKIYLTGLSVSCYGIGYRPSYWDSFYRPVVQAEGCSLTGTDLNMNHANFVKSLSREVKLRDGTELFLDQTSENKSILGSFHSNFKVEALRTKNSVSNVLNGVSDSIYDFTTSPSTSREIVFKNLDGLNVDCLTLVNITGIHSFTLRGGDFNELTNEWISYEEESYVVPYVRHNVLDISGSAILIDTDEKYEKDQLAGNTLFVVNRTNGDTSRPRIVLSNYENVVVLNSPISIGADDAVKIVKRSASFDIPDVIGSANKKYFSVLFRSVSSAPVRSVGEVVFGRWCDLSDYHVEIDREREIPNQNISSDYGMTFNPRTDSTGVTSDKISVNFTYLSDDFGDFENCKNIFKSIHSSNKNFPIILDLDGKQTTEYVAFNSELSFAPEGYGKTLKISLSSQGQRMIPGRNKSNPGDA
jgi:hypothetical protein